jgi:hypothetical protein
VFLGRKRNPAPFSPLLLPTLTLWTEIRSDSAQDLTHWLHKRASEVRPGMKKDVTISLNTPVAPALLAR